jgi:hypothetical protein
MDRSDERVSVEQRLPFTLGSSSRYHLHDRDFTLADRQVRSTSREQSRSVRPDLAIEEYGQRHSRIKTETREGDLKIKGLIGISNIRNTAEDRIS